jgi:hypothetical protein
MTRSPDRSAPSGDIIAEASLAWRTANVPLSDRQNPVLPTPPVFHRREWANSAFPNVFRHASGESRYDDRSAARVDNSIRNRWQSASSTIAHSMTPVYRASADLTQCPWPERDVSQNNIQSLNQHYDGNPIDRRRHRTVTLDCPHARLQLNSVLSNGE